MCHHLLEPMQYKCIYCKNNGSKAIKYCTTDNQKQAKDLNYAYKTVHTTSPTTSALLIQQNLCTVGMRKMVPSLVNINPSFENLKKITLFRITCVRIITYMILIYSHVTQLISAKAWIEASAVNP